VKRIILYVDDNNEDALLVERAIGKADLAAQFFRAPDGCEAAEWLIGSGAYADRVKFPLPDVLIVDLRMPRNSGFDLLEFVQARRELKKVVLIVYSDSDSPQDKLRAFQTGANAYVQKNQGTEALMVYVRSATATSPREIEGETQFR
jgi:CheY-like chemotaxis protein